MRRATAIAKPSKVAHPAHATVTTADRKAAAEALGVHGFQSHDVELWIQLNHELHCSVMREEHCVRLYRVAQAIADARAAGARATRKD